MTEERKAAQFRQYMSKGDGSMTTYSTPSNDNIGLPEISMIDHPNHYTQYQGFEVMDVCRQLNSPDGDANWFRGNIFKYLARAGWKDRGNRGKELEDLKKSRHYLDREIARIEAAIQLEDAEKSQGWMAVGADEEPTGEVQPRRTLSDEENAERTMRFETSTTNIPRQRGYLETQLPENYQPLAGIIHPTMCSTCGEALTRDEAGLLDWSCPDGHSAFGKI